MSTKHGRKDISQDFGTNSGEPKNLKYTETSCQYFLGMQGKKGHEKKCFACRFNELRPETGGRGFTEKTKEKKEKQQGGKV